MNGRYVSYDLSMLALNSSDLIIPNDYFNGDDVTSFNISNNGNLKQIDIGNYTFRKVRSFELNGLSELESVVIGKKSFTLTNTYDDIRNSRRTDGSCRIVNCPKLKFIQIGDLSFHDYHSFELNNLPSLQSIDIGENCFYYASSFSLTGSID